MNQTKMLHTIKFRGKRIRLKIPVTVSISCDEGIYYIVSEELMVYGYGKTEKEAMEEFHSIFLDMIAIAKKYGRRGNRGIDRLMWHVTGVK